MDTQTLIIVAVVVALVFFFMRRGKGGEAAAPAAACTAGQGGAACSGGGTACSSTGDLAAYRKAYPSNQIQGQVTCRHCGSNRVHAGHCDSCGATLYRA